MSALPAREPIRPVLIDVDLPAPVAMPPKRIRVRRKNARYNKDPEPPA